MRARSVHKVVGIMIGVFVLLWAATGAIMMMPGMRTVSAWAAPPDYTLAAIPPAEAIRLFHALDSTRQVQDLQLVTVLDRVAYRIRTPRLTVLLDARTGREFQVDLGMAVAIARAHFGAPPGQITVERLTRHDLWYPAGELPVFRVNLDDGAATVAHVSPADGAVHLSDRTRRLRSLAGRFHDFSVLRVLTGSRDLQLGSVFATSAIAVLSGLTGYWLAFSRRRHAVVKR